MRGIGHKNAEPVKVLTKNILNADLNESWMWAELQGRILVCFCKASDAISVSGTSAASTWLWRSRPRIEHGGSPENGIRMLASLQRPNTRTQTTTGVWTYKCTTSAFPSICQHELLIVLLLLITHCVHTRMQKQRHTFGHTNHPHRHIHTHSNALINAHIVFQMNTWGACCKWAKRATFSFVG